VGQLFLAFPLGCVSPGSAPVCLLLFSGQLPDHLLLLPLPSSGRPLPLFALPL
jgi:hypothetical protein